jgi:polysaccharide deacetylase family protein (PEP-CTERM system associated)
MSVKHCLSFDVEEHFQVSAFESPMRRRHWDLYESRVEKNTSRLLDLLAGHDVRATFFVLGWVGERFPHLVKQIASAGHEIASHGYGHELIMAQTPSAFRDDVRKAKCILEQLVSQPICGYRAPSFSITKDTTWALSVLAEEGYLYDSSIFPIFHDRYGIPSASVHIHQIYTESGNLWEVPPSVVRLLGLNIPVAGGGYFRLYPYFLLRWLLRRLDKETTPLVMYLHPWEFDPDQPRMDGPFVSRIRHYLNLRKAEIKLNRLLDDFDFVPICKAIGPLNIIGQEKQSMPRSFEPCLRSITAQ